jgi:hypothetical protein
MTAKVIGEAKTCSYLGSVGFDDGPCTRGNIVSETEVAHRDVEVEARVFVVAGSHDEGFLALVC